MKTDELVSLLAAGSAPVPANAVGRRFAMALGWGLPAAGLWMLVTLGVRADLAQDAGKLMFWLKMAFPASLALAGLVAAERLARPGMRLGGFWLALAAPVLMVWLLAASVLLNAAPAQRAGLILGSTWSICPFNIALISLPLFVATLWAMKGLAPTRPMLAGAGAGLLAGALGALVYSLHCPELAAPFLAVWYVLGMAIPALAGAMLGPRVLRW